MANTLRSSSDGRSKLPLLLSVKQVTYELGLGRTIVYELIATGKLRSVKIGRRRCVPCEAIEEFIAGLVLEGRPT